MYPADSEKSPGSKGQHCTTAPSPRELQRMAARDHLALFEKIPIPELRSPTYQQVIELYTIFVFLYAYAIEIDFQDSSFFKDTHPALVILNNINRLTLVLTQGGLKKTAGMLLAIIYEAIQILDMVVFLFLESDLVEAAQATDKALALAFESGRNDHPQTTIAEEWTIHFMDFQYKSRVQEACAIPYITSQVVDIALNFCRKLLQKLQGTYNHFVPLLADERLIREYDSFIHTSAGTRKMSDIAKTGIQHPLEEYHSCLRMKASRKLLCFREAIRFNPSYQNCDYRWLTIMRSTIAHKVSIPHKDIFQIIMVEAQRKYPPLLVDMTI